MKLEARDSQEVPFLFNCNISLFPQPPTPNTRGRGAGSHSFEKPGLSVIPLMLPTAGAAQEPAAPVPLGTPLSPSQCRISEAGSLPTPYFPFPRANSGCAHLADVGQAAVAQAPITATAKGHDDATV